MTSLYNKADHTLTEQPEMEKPDINDFKDPVWCPAGDCPAYRGCMSQYEKHLAKLRTIPCDPSCKDLWSDKQILVEGKDYEIKGAGDWKWCYQLKGKIFAAPILPAKSEEELLQLARSILATKGIENLPEILGDELGGRIYELLYKITKKTS